VNRQLGAVSGLGPSGRCTYLNVEIPGSWAAENPISGVPPSVLVAKEQDMKKVLSRSAVGLVAAGYLVWTSLGFSAAAATAADPGASATDPRLDMITTLKATGPHPSLGEHAKVFGRLIGVWDGEYTEISSDGRETRSSGEWIFGWVMDGRAIQDLFIIHPSAARKERYIGTTVRYFDPKSETWSVTFIDPEYGAIETLTGNAVGDDRIVLLSQDKDGQERRWSLEDIRPDSWVFRDEVSIDGGKTWRLREVDRMKRRSATASARRWSLHAARTIETPRNI
jgi:hypothetical protein